jgi:hypothetical protein
MNSNVGQADDVDGAADFVLESRPELNPSGPVRAEAEL